MYIDGRRIGRRVRLKMRSIDHREVYTKQTDEIIGPLNAVQIVENFDFRGRNIFPSGDIYEAPYCLIELNWKGASPVQRAISRVLPKNRKSSNIIREMEEQIEFTHAKLFELNETLRESERKSRIFRVYTRSSLAAHVDLGQDPTRFEPKEEYRAILFNDLRGFTSLSEKMRPIDVVLFLNEYFDIMNDIIHENNGEIDKLMGDCIMAEFKNCDDAVKVAIQMKKQVRNYNRSRVDRHLPPVSFGVGVCYGPVIIGNIGSDRKMDYTLIGDAVNAASRLESLTKYYSVGIVISGQVFENLAGQYCLRPLDIVHVKGKREPVELYEVFDYEPEEIRNKKLKLIPELTRAFELYKEACFDEAGKLYGRLIDTIGPHRYRKDLCLDPALNFFQSRCISNCELLRKGILSQKEWSGVSSMPK